MSAARIGLVYPELLGTYGDGGNAEVLAARARWRGIDANVVTIPAGEQVPGSCDLYVVGGGEDEPQQLAAAGLRDSPGLRTAVEAGAVLLAVCAGVQILGESFPGQGGAIADGAGLLPLRTRRSFLGEGVPPPPRAVGDLAVRPAPGGFVAGVPVLLGYENHGGRTVPVPGTRIGTDGAPLGAVVGGVGMAVGNGDGTDGWLIDHGPGRGAVVATYLHGPALAQNPALADALLARALGLGTLAPLDRPDPAAALRAARLRRLGLPPD